MALKDTAKMNAAIKLAQEAKMLRNRAQTVENEAVESFRQAREEMIQTLPAQREKLEQQLRTLRTEHYELAPLFCEQKGGHTGHCRTVRTSNKPLYHSFGEGNVYPTKTYVCNCLICGFNPPDFHFEDHRIRSHRRYQEGSEDEIKKASEQDKNLSLKKTAQRILEIREQIKICEEKLGQIRKDLAEICSLFGHEAEIISNYKERVFKCKCCGEEMKDSEYTVAYRNAKYKGGIVPQIYCEFSGYEPIL